MRSGSKDLQKRRSLKKKHFVLILFWKGGAYKVSRPGSRVTRFEEPFVSETVLQERVARRAGAQEDDRDREEDLE